MGGRIHSEKQKRERLNKENYNTYGTLMKIVEYNGYTDIWVEFQDEYRAKVHTTYSAFKRGGVKNPYDREVHNVGCFGVGEYKSRDEEGKKTLAYRYWMDMIDRCYNPYRLNEFIAYRDTLVCKEWLCFQNFAKWFYENYYEIENEKMQLDKDILYKDNKVYSPETCIFVSKRINCLFIKQKNQRGSLPIGVSYHKQHNKLYVSCDIIDDNYRHKQKFLGLFPLNKPFQAFYEYKQFKENYIKQIADEYKKLIPQKLYEALYKYEIEIND